MLRLSRLGFPRCPERLSTTCMQNYARIHIGKVDESPKRKKKSPKKEHPPAAKQTATDKENTSSGMEERLATLADNLANIKTKTTVAAKLRSEKSNQSPTKAMKTVQKSDNSKKILLPSDLKSKEINKTMKMSVLTDETSVAHLKRKRKSSCSDNSAGLETFQEHVRRQFSRSFQKMILVAVPNNVNITKVLGNVEHVFGKIASCHELPFAEEKSYQEQSLLLVELKDRVYCEFPCFKANDFAKVRSQSQNPPLVLDVKKCGPMFDKQDLHSCSDVTEQILELYEAVKMSDTMYMYQFFICALFRKIVSPVFKGDAMCFGSGSYGGALRGSSDVDISIQTKDEDEAEVLEAIMSHLRKSSKGMFYRWQTYPRAKVPIVTFLDRLFNISVDVSTNNMEGMMMAEAMYWLKYLYPDFLPLVITLKYWAQINNVLRKPSFKNHMIIMLLIGFLQHKKVLPPFSELYADPSYSRQRNSTPYKTPHEMKALAINLQRASGSPRAGELLLEFFHFCSTSDFRSFVMDIHSGAMIERDHLFPVVIIDPHDKDNNIWRNAKQGGVDKFQVACRNSYEKLKNHMTPHDSMKCNGKLKDCEASEIKGTELSKTKDTVSCGMPGHNDSFSSKETSELETSGEEIWGLQTILPIDGGKATENLFSLVYHDSDESEGNTATEVIVDSDGTTVNGINDSD